MSFVANPFVVILDANVLYPFRTRDVLFSFAQAGLFRARFTDEILDEWTRSLIENRPQFEASVRQQEAAIRDVFDECLVTGHAPLIPGLLLPDEDDRHVLAAAIKCSAQIIVTENHKDFPADRLEEYGVETLGADEFLANTYDLFPKDGARVLKEVRLRYDNPPFTRSEFLMDLIKSGLPKLAALARVDIEYL
ncbi:MAG: PIN domain-containing protein [Rhodobacteraceae bacterium]|nr:PIN domain-containing protein [Paracoccaceae bacterium]